LMRSRARPENIPWVTARVTHLAPAAISARVALSTVPAAGRRVGGGAQDPDPDLAA